MMEKKTLSADLIIEIISRLPVKDLMRFKCVSKSWLSLISYDSHFAYLQLERTASTDLPFMVLQEIQLATYFELYHYWFDLESLEEGNTPPKEMHYPFGLDNAAPRRNAGIVASCDGLLVFEQFGGTPSLSLLNLSTGKYHLVPPNPAGKDKVMFRGFGYGGECYKLVTVMIPTKTDSTIHLVIYYVNDTWRKIQFQCQFQFDDLGCEKYVVSVYANNVLFLNLDDSQGKIICFDMAEEEFFEMKTPDFGHDMCEVEMVGFDEKLCLVCTWIGEDFEEMRTDIWVLAGKCWTKLFTILDARTKLYPSDVNKSSTGLIPKCYPACRNKVLFEASCHKLLWYNLETEEFEESSNRVNPREFHSLTICK